MRLDGSNPGGPSGILPVSQGGTGASTASAARTNLGLGTMATQDASAVAITGGAIDATTIGATTPVQAQTRRPTNAQVGTTYTLVLGDAGKMVSLNNAAAITLTIPLNATVAFPTNTEIDLCQLGAGQVNVSPTGGVTLNSFASLTHLGGQYAGGSLKKLGTDTWLLVGNLA